MIRAAKFQDVPAISALLREMLPMSKYAGRTGINEKALESVVMAMIAGQRQNGPQATFCHVAEERGATVGLMAGALDRVYHFGEKLEAKDAYLHVREGEAAKHTFQLIDAYIAWAAANPKVIDVWLSWHDALPGAERIAPLYQRKGFTLVGEMYGMRLDQSARKAA